MHIYYYSGTGNSLYIAKRLKTEEDDLIPMIPAVKKETMELPEDILLVFPVYMNGLPKPVKELY